MFEQTFKNIDDILQKDAGCSSELDYVEQTSWILFLKYLDDLERDNKIKAELKGEVYTDIIEYKIGEIFSELRNKIQSGYILREILNMIDELHFRSQAEKHEMSHLY